MLKTHKMHQTLKTQVLEMQVPKTQEIAAQKKHQTALVTQLEIATNF